jgi:hypothetical protein
MLENALKYVQNKIADLEDDLQHYTMVEHDKCKEFYIREDLKQFKEILECLQNLKALEDTKSSNASIDVATKMLLEKLEMLSDCAEAMKEAPSSNWIEYAKTEAELDLKLYFAFLDIKQTILKAQEQEKENKKMKALLLELADISPDNVDCINQCKFITNTILKANISDDVNNKCKKNLEDLDLR